MTVGVKIKTIDNKIEENKVQYNLDRQTANTLALSLKNIDKYEILTGGDILTEKELLQKSATIKNLNIYDQKIN